MIRMTFAVFGIGVLLIVSAAVVVLVVATLAPEGFEDEQGYHSVADPPSHPSV
jgi:hypothetical protein